MPQALYHVFVYSAVFKTTTSEWYKPVVTEKKAVRERTPNERKIFNSKTLNFQRTKHIRNPHFFSVMSTASRCVFHIFVT